MTELAPLHKMLTGPNAFYNKPDYLETTKTELSAPKALPPSYIMQTESKIIRYIKTFFSLLIFPITAIKTLIGYAMFPSTFMSFSAHVKELVNIFRGAIVSTETGDFKYKRITVKINDKNVDALLVGRPSTFGNGRWMLCSNGNAEFYEGRLIDENRFGGVIERKNFKDLLKNLNANALFYNYPGCGASTGMPSRDAVLNTHSGLLDMLEDKEKGIGADQLIDYGYSMGGRVVGAGRRTSKPGRKYVRIEDRSFSTLGNVLYGFKRGKLLHFLARIFGWDYDFAKGARLFPHPEIVIQTADVQKPGPLTSPDSIKHDTVISQFASLAWGMYGELKYRNDMPETIKKNKYLVAIPETHNDPLGNTNYLASVVNRCFASAASAA